MGRGSRGGGDGRGGGIALGMGWNVGDLREEHLRRSHREVAMSLGRGEDGTDEDGMALAVEQPPCSQIIAKHTITALSMYQLHSDHL